MRRPFPRQREREPITRPPTRPPTPSFNRPVQQDEFDYTDFYDYEADSDPSRSGKEVRALKQFLCDVGEAKKLGFRRREGDTLETN